MTDRKREIVKYGFRFGVIIAIVAPILRFTQGENALRVIAYKVALAVLGVGLSEFIWMTHFKGYFGRVEDLHDEEKHSVLVFRGILYAAIIVALTLGL